MTIERTVFGSVIRAELTSLDAGYSVLLAGGHCSHIGSVSVARPEEPVRTLTFPEHREQAVSEKWARTLAERLRCPVAVTCGIHYDNLSREGLEQVLRTLDDMLEQASEAQ